MARPIKTGTDQNPRESDDRRPAADGPREAAAAADRGPARASDAADDWARILERPAIQEAIASVRRVSGLKDDLPAGVKARAAPSPAAAARPTPEPAPRQRSQAVAPRQAPAPPQPPRGPGPEVRRRQTRPGVADGEEPARLPRPTPQAPVETDQGSSPADRRTARIAPWQRADMPPPGQPQQPRPLPFLPAETPAPRPRAEAQPARAAPPPSSARAAPSSAGKLARRPPPDPGAASGRVQEPPGARASAAHPPARRAAPQPPPSDDARFATLVPVRRAPKPVEAARRRVRLLPFVLIGAAALGVGAGLAFTGQMFKENVELGGRQPASPVLAIEEPEGPATETSDVPQTELAEPLPAVPAGDPASGMAMIPPPPAKPVRLPAVAVDGVGGPAEAPATAAPQRSPADEPRADSSAAAIAWRGTDGVRMTRPGDGPAIGPAPAVQGELAIDAPLFLGQVFVHYSTIGDRPGDEAAAMAVSQRLEQAGYRITDIRPVGFRIRRANIRYFHPEDRAPAERLRRDLAVTMDPPPAVVDFTTYRPRPRAGTLEVWVEGSS